jgi:ABC-type amino acid transport substrate-binding protein
MRAYPQNQRIGGMVQRLWIAGAVLGSAALLSGTAVLACGDKLLAIGRGVRFQRAYAATQANLLIYSTGTQRDAILSSTKLQTTLKRAGHKLQIVEGDSQLDEALKSGKVDVVLVDFGDLGRITRLLQSAPSKPSILPILFKPSKAELAAAQREYKFVLKAPADETQYLIAIDEAMKFRLRAGTKS